MDARDVVIRPARSDDADAVLALLRELGYVALERGAFEPAFDAVLAHGEMRVLVAEGDEPGALVGLLTLSHRPQLRLGGALVTIDELVVAQGARGRGVGRALLEAAKAVASARGARRVELITNRTRESYARGFYVKNGFVEVPSAVMRLR